MLRGKQIAKGTTRTAIDMLVDIFKGYKGEPTKIDVQRARMKKAEEERAKSEKAEAKAQDIHTE